MFRKTNVGVICFVSQAKERGELPQVQNLIRYGLISEAIGNLCKGEIRLLGMAITYPAYGLRNSWCSSRERGKISQEICRRLILYQFLGPLRVPPLTSRCPSCQ
jgi:hypothetical protein